MVNNLPPAIAAIAITTETIVQAVAAVAPTTIISHFNCLFVWRVDLLRNYSKFIEWVFRSQFLLLFILKKIYQKTKNFTSTKNLFILLDLKPIDVFKTFLTNVFHIFSVFIFLKNISAFVLNSLSNLFIQQHKNSRKIYILLISRFS